MENIWSMEKKFDVEYNQLKMVKEITLYNEFQEMKQKIMTLENMIMAFNIPTNSIKNFLDD